MSRIGIFFAEGYEEIEALTVVDLVRRAGISIDMISVTEAGEVTGSHGITVKMDRTLAETDFSQLDMLVLPGGMPGTKGLEDCEALMEKLDEFYTSGKYIAAICAAPSIFGHRGYLKGRKATSYPDFEAIWRAPMLPEQPQSWMEMSLPAEEWAVPFPSDSL